MSTVRLPLVAGGRGRLGGVAGRIDLAGGGTWYEAHGIGRRKMKEVPGLMARATVKEFAVCLHADGADDLVERKVYPVVRDEAAEAKGFLRVIDESGEDYLYPLGLFAFVDVPEEAAKELRAPRARG